MNQEWITLLYKSSATEFPLSLNTVPGNTKVTHYTHNIQYKHTTTSIGSVRNCNLLHDCEILFLFIAIYISRVWLNGAERNCEHDQLIGDAIPIALARALAIALAKLCVCSVGVSVCLLALGKKGQTKWKWVWVRFVEDNKIGRQIKVEKRVYVYQMKCTDASDEEVGVGSASLFPNRPKMSCS